VVANQSTRLTFFQHFCLTVVILPVNLFPMKVFKILFHPGKVKAPAGGNIDFPEGVEYAFPCVFEDGGYGGLCVGVVIDQDGSHTNEQVLTAWNNANPSYQGDTAMDGPFLTI
jgi:hypothetical protein